MYKIITKSAHNALLYQIEDLKKKFESANENIESYKEDLNEAEDDIKHLLERSAKLKEANEFLNTELRNSKNNIQQTKIYFDKLHIDLNNAKKKYDLCASRHKSCILRNEKLQKANTSLLSKNESLTAENHRLGNLLQVKCDEVKTLEKKVDSTGLLANDFNKLKANADDIERHVLDAVKTLDVPHAKRNKCVADAMRQLKEALKIRQ